ncbi:MAG: hypothetical protein GXY07_06785 [Candidatus Hydrogenedentes bacterium]|nr:hypothetical protein [Candidatus Hydrogenedentota bacterium]
MLAEHPQQNQILRLMLELDPIRRGAIRWVSEEVWEESDPEGRYPRNPNRTAHPGCVQCTPDTESVAIIMIHGHTRIKGSPRYELPVKGITQEERVTYFNINRCYPISASLFWAKNSVWKDGLSKTMLSPSEMSEFQYIEDCYAAECRKPMKNKAQAVFSAAHTPHPQDDIAIGKGR